ncbi:MAG: hypothetical protein ACOZIN_00480 [Myxococcota bacterium]
MRHAWLGVAALCACGPPPQTKDEAAVTYRASFTAEGGVNAKVVFPFPVDGAALVVEQGLQVSDAGTARMENAQEGSGLALEGNGYVEVTFSAPKVKGLGSGGIPEAMLSRPVPDGGMGDRYMRVNKGGSASVQVEFEYTASRDCGASCGGKRSWTYQGPVGLSLQEVPMGFSEEKRP